MMPDIQSLNKRYYTISEVAEMFDVSKSLIRYWEAEFEFLKPHKNSKGDRRFTVQNVEQFSEIYHLVKEKGFTLEGARKELRIKHSRGGGRQTSPVDQLLKIRTGLMGILQKL
jgi:DNA-binding transcriptional MerR regulator